MVRIHLGCIPEAEVAQFVNSNCQRLAELVHPTVLSDGHDLRHVGVLDVMARERVEHLVT